MTRYFFFAVALALVVFVMGCPSKSNDKVSSDSDPSISLTPDSGGLLLTWIDDKGDFHVEQRVSEVPLEGRDAVRVVDPNREEGTASDKVLVADLRTLRPDGTYPVSVMSRTDFEALAVARRAKAGPTLASASPQTSASASNGPAPQPPPDHGGLPDLAGTKRPDVIIYGAEWCGPCHQAQAYLTKRGISFVEKDVDKDPGAVKEMQAKLAKAGIRYTGNIPVIDVRGKMMIGFDPQAMDEALGKAL